MTESVETPEKPKNEWIENARVIGGAVLLFMVIRVFVFQPFTIPSPSMEPLLRAGDYIFVTKFDYGISHVSIPFSPPLFKGRILARTPKRGDVIVFKVPTDHNKDYIKRLIGLPGDRIQVKSGVLYINGSAVPQRALGWEKAQSEYLTAHKLGETLPGDKRAYVTYDSGYSSAADDTAVFLVPEGRYFFMGDNRDNSADSRFATERGGVGFVSSENLVGRARFILLSWTPDVSIFKPWTWFTKALPGRFFQKIS